MRLTLKSTDARLGDIDKKLDTEHSLSLMSQRHMEIPFFVKDTASHNELVAYRVPGKRLLNRN